LSGQRPDLAVDAAVREEVSVMRPDSATERDEGPALSAKLADCARDVDAASTRIDRKSTRLNSSHEWISYAVFCLKKKKSSTLRPPAQPRAGALQRHRSSRVRALARLETSLLELHENAAKDLPVAWAIRAALHTVR